MTNKLYLVTGGAGFIGSHIAERLLAEGHQVRVLDNLSSGKEENLTGLAAASGKLELMRGDIRKLDQVRESMKGVEIVFHEAALGSVPRSVEDPITTHDS